MKHQISIWVQYGFVVVLLSIAGVLFYQRDTINHSVFGFETQEKKKRKRTSKQVPVIVSKVTLTNDDQIIKAIGDGRAKRFVTLFSEAAGVVVHVPVKAGDRVQKGDIILQLDDRKARLAVQVAETKLVEARRKMERAIQLYKQKVASQATVDDEKTLFQRAEFELQQAKEALGDRAVSAPFSGFLGILKVEPGDRIETNTAIVTLDNRSVIRVEFDVSEKYHSQLDVEQKVIAKTPTVQNRSFDGVIKEIDSRIDTTSRMVKVRADIPNKEDVLRPGMSFAVELIIPGQNHPTVPELALQWGKGQSYVWRIKDGKAERVVVDLIKRTKSLILLEGDLKEGDLVVTEGVQRLRPGKAVKFTLPGTPERGRVSQLGEQYGQK